MKGSNDRSDAQASARMPQRLESRKEYIALTISDRPMTDSSLARESGMQFHSTGGTDDDCPTLKTIQKST